MMMITVNSKNDITLMNISNGNIFSYANQYYIKSSELTPGMRFICVNIMTGEAVEIDSCTTVRSVDTKIHIYE